MVSSFCQVSSLDFDHVDENRAVRFVSGIDWMFEAGRRRSTFVTWGDGLYTRRLLQTERVHVCFVIW